jgi:hypothetical protein
MHTGCGQVTIEAVAIVDPVPVLPTIPAITSTATIVMTTAESSSSSTISNITPTLAPGQSVTTMSFTFSSMSIDDCCASAFISVLATHLHLDQSKLVVLLITQLTSDDPAQPTPVNTIVVSVSIETPPSSVDAFVNQLSSVTTSAIFRGLRNAAIPSSVNSGVTSSQPTVSSSAPQASTGSSSSSTPSIIIAVVVCATFHFHRGSRCYWPISPSHRCTQSHRCSTHTWTCSRTQHDGQLDVCCH